ncbi:Translin-1 [Golovinomyces cichoracearum]|uniref:Translin-1 n=1 Tax=Golovinomyces cichoracearum TaxID=62708 RepID=A0A420J3Q1_9PEZI|nr:Translin-1 [Golovinomyces cichoracearum]
MSNTTGAINNEIFQNLQKEIDSDAYVKEQIKEITQSLERQGRAALAVLSQAHSTREADPANAQSVHPIISTAESLIKEEIITVGLLAKLASSSPFYKYNNLWTREIQTVIFSIVLCAWLGGLQSHSNSGRRGKLLSIEECGEILNVPVNLKDRDAFHITIEDYLHSLISLIEELARLAINSVTLGDYRRPLEISQFVKELHAGFQVLNLKNDSLRRRSDSIKYNVKKIEDIVYDLSLRNLVPK